MSAQQSCAEAIAPFASHASTDTLPSRTASPTSVAGPLQARASGCRTPPGHRGWMDRCPAIAASTLSASPSRPSTCRCSELCRCRYYPRDPLVCGSSPPRMLTSLPTPITVSIAVRPGLAQPEQGSEQGRRRGRQVRSIEDGGHPGLPAAIQRGASQSPAPTDL